MSTPERILGMPVSTVLSRTAEGDFVQNGNIVLDDGRFPGHETSRVIKQNAFSDDGSRVNVNRIDDGNQALQVKSNDPFDLHSTNNVRIDKRTRPEIL